jgi:transposase
MEHLPELWNTCPFNKIYGTLARKFHKQNLWNTCPNGHGTLAHSMATKFMEHLPENSINKIYGTLARMGLECCQEADESMPAGLEELGEGGVDGQPTP